MKTTRQPRISVLLILFWLSALVTAAPPATAALQDPSVFVGQPVGADGHLLKWDTIVRYARHVAAESPRVQVVEVGRSTQDRPFLLTLCGDESSLQDIERYRDIVRRLADPAATTPEEAAQLARDGKVIVVFTLSLHSIETGAAQGSLELLHAMASIEEPWMDEIRESVILLIFPSMNPDGHDIVADWYNSTVGTPAEGTYPIELYHPYAGHDNNRDAFFNNLVETSHLSRVMYREWLPQLILDQHQMGSSGPRLFLPPFDDPMSKTVHPLVFSQLSAASQQMVSDLHAGGWRGIVTKDRFTAEWPGSIRSTGFWHNVMGILSEVASVRLATPLFFPPGSLRPGGRGLPEYERRSNFLDPWPGGWWRLRDIIDIEQDLSWSLLRWCADHREDILLNFYRMNREAVLKGRREKPHGFAWSLDGQHDRWSGHRLAAVLGAGGVRVEQLDGDVEIEGRRYAGPVALVNCAQPYRPYILEMMGAASYPRVRESAGGPLVTPYDVTAWSLPDFLGVEVQELKEPVEVAGVLPADPGVGIPGPRGIPSIVPPGDGFGAFAMSPRDNRSFTAALRFLRDGGSVRRVRAIESPRRRPARVSIDDAVSPFELEPGTWILLPGNGATGTFVESVSRAANGLGVHLTGLVSPPADSLMLTVRDPRIALYSPWGGSMDEGWTRLVLDRHDFNYTTVRNADLRGPLDNRGREIGPRPGPLGNRFDVIVLPDMSKSWLENGRHEITPDDMYTPTWPVENRGGLGKDRAVARLKTFVRNGGTIVAFDSACEYLIEHLGLPVRSVLKEMERDEFDAPGTLVRLDVDPREPAAFGMPATTAAWFARSSAFEPIGWHRPTGVPARYAGDPTELRVGGYLRGSDVLSGQAAAVDVPMGRGHIILYGFRPQNRGQMEATFKFVFNALVNPPVAD